MYEPWIYQMYNIVFTAFPIMWYCVMDTEFKKNVYITDPDVYQLGLRDAGFNVKMFWV